MSGAIQGLLTVLSCVTLCAMSFLSAVGQQIPRFNPMSKYMLSEGVPMPQVMLAGAIVFLVFGSRGHSRGAAAQEIL